jgi:2-polyprenyl-3-methyl-5-hydroxy-6-metoxy-1,4-benzoquinol methylase
MFKYKNIEIPDIVDFEKPVHVENRNFRTKNTDNYFELSSKEAIDFPNKDGLIVSEDYVNFVDCPVCGSKNNKQLFVKWGFKHSVCMKCDHTYVENQMNTSKLKELYKNSDIDKQFQLRKKQDNDLNKYWILLYAKYLKILQKNSPNNSLLLDVGAGGGDFLALCDEVTDFELHAMEFSENSVEFLETIVGKNNLYREEISNTEFNGIQFDIITMFGVLEHINNPVKELKKCKEILSVNGKVLILVPNLYCRAFKILGINIPTLNPRSHLNYFCKKSMEYLCNEVGLKVAEYYQELPVIDLMYDFIDYSDKLVDDILDNNEAYYSIYLLGHAD